MNIIFSIVLGYFIGSIPTAFIVIKISKGLDIRKLGSGNVGTYNSYEVTNSKVIGISVLLIDLLKGLVSVLIIKYLYGDLFVLPMIGLLFAVIGHCYSVWLKFKGGRGLATAAGGFLVISPLIIAVWLTCWVIVYKWKKDIHFANITATIIIIISTLIFSSQFNNLSFPPADTSFIFGFSLSLLMIIILSKHWESLKLILTRTKQDI